MVWGFLPIWKPAGISSAGVVGRVRYLTQASKAGHSGTLDPGAQGVLVLALNRATVLLPYLPTDKKYVAVIRLGEITDTLDSQGQIVERRPVPLFSRAHLEVALNRFRGPILQIPPMVSALHHGGERLYHIARRGGTVDRPPRPVTVHALDLLAVDPRDICIAVHCSSGTYIRSLAADLGDVLGCGAHLHSLERTQCGGFGQTQAITLEDLGHEVMSGEWSRHLVSPESALAFLPGIEVTGPLEIAVRHGRWLGLPECLASVPEGPVRVLDGAGRLLALGRRQAEAFILERVIRPASKEPTCS